MARYNTSIPATTATGAATYGTPSTGVFTTLSGSAPYTITLADPVLFAGAHQTFWNNTSGTVTLSTPNGNIKTASNSATTFAMAANTMVSLASNGADYIMYSAQGGPLTGTSADISATLTIGSGGSIAVNSSSGVTTNQTTLPVFNTTATTVNFAGAATSLNMGAATGTTTINNDTNLGSGKVLKIGGTQVLSSSTLGSGVTGSSLTSVGTLTGLTVSGTLALSSSSATHTISSSTASTTTGTGALTVTGGVGIGGQLTATTIVETSSIAFKENVEPITGALDAVLSLLGVTYDRKDSKEHEAGLIAEEVYKILPDLVSLDANGKPHGVKYTKLSVYLLESIKALKQEINELKGK